MKRTSSIVLSIGLFGVAITICGCGLSKEQQENTDSTEQTITVSEADLVMGKRLSKIYCVRCHTYPDPKLLDKRTWVNQTLPNMGPRLGIFEHNGEKYPLEKTDNLPKDLYPDTAQISQANWQKILDYYKTNAPEKLNPAKREQEIVNDPLFFKARTPGYRNQAPPMVTSIRFDPGNKTIYLSNASDNKFLIFNEQLRLADHLNLSSTLSDIDILNPDISRPGKRELLLTYIGVLSPSDALKGSVMKSSYDPKTKKADAGSYVVNHIERPVESQMADLDQDGNPDYLINEFGHRKGHLFWLKNDEKNTNANKQILTDSPGCIKSEVHDLTKNGLPDVIALCTQSDEAIYLFKNKGNGMFEQDTLLQFDVVAGSSSFEMDDFNNDGYLDIVYTSGDNADYSSIYKPYHGVYIYLNDGANHFTQKWFYPIDGAYNAKARDFDKDGDLDLAVIAFFADYENDPEEGFIYFENEGDLSFTPYHHPAALSGRWITMDVADWTGNGYDDIILGNFSLGPTKVVSQIQDKWMKGPHFLILENHADSAAN